MENVIFFDTDKVAAELRISRDEYSTLKTSVREEFPEDEMMYQLHLLRALRGSFSATVLCCCFFFFGKRNNLVN